MSYSPDNSIQNRPPLIRLARAKDRLVRVTRPKVRQPGDRPFTPFQMPLFPLSQHRWLGGLGLEFFKRQHRYLAVLLTLDCEGQRWCRPVIPAQTCGKMGSCWTLDLGKSYPLPPGKRVAGSFQVCRAASIMEAVDAVPILDGLHIVQAMSDDEVNPYFFLRAENHTGVGIPEEIIANDWDLALQEASGRMSFE